MMVYVPFSHSIARCYYKYMNLLDGICRFFLSAMEPHGSNHTIFSMDIFF
jgi:hypothetical protein